MKKTLSKALLLIITLALVITVVPTTSQAKKKTPKVIGNETAEITLDDTLYEKGKMSFDFSSILNKYKKKGIQSIAYATLNKKDIVECEDDGNIWLKPTKKYGVFNCVLNYELAGDDFYDLMTIDGYMKESVKLTLKSKNWRKNPQKVIVVVRIKIGSITKNEDVLNREERERIKAEEEEYKQKVISLLKEQTADPDKTYMELYGKKFKSTVPFEYKQYIILKNYFAGSVTIWASQPTIKVPTYYDEETGTYRFEVPNPDAVQAINGDWYVPGTGAIPHMWYTYVLHDDGKYYRDHYQGNETWKNLYEGTYMGVCGESSKKVQEVLDALGFETRYFENFKENHGWVCMKLTDSSGTEYWQHVPGTAYGYNLKYSTTTTDIENWDATSNTKTNYKEFCYKPTWNF